MPNFNKNIYFILIKIKNLDFNIVIFAIITLFKSVGKHLKEIYQF